MTEDEIRAIVRDEITKIRQEEAEAQAEADYFLEEVRERREKREARQRQYDLEERQQLENRLSELEDAQYRRR